MADLTNAREIRPGTDDPIIKWSACTDCGGCGWHCKNQFATFNRRYVQCPTCEAAYRTAGVPASSEPEPKGGA